MDRYNFKEYITSYIDGDISDSNRELFEKLLESDSECQEEYQEVSKLINNLNSFPKLKSNNDFIQDLNQRIDNYEKSKTPVFNKIKDYLSSLEPRPSLGFAMSIGAIMMVSYLYLGNPSTTDSSSITTTIPEEKILKEEMYLSDSDSSDYDEYEDDIQLTKGSK